MSGIPFYDLLHVAVGQPPNDAAMNYQDRCPPCQARWLATTTMRKNGKDLLRHIFNMIDSSVVICSPSQKIKKYSSIF
ncbi:hypothetical protein NOC27_3255 [Nitrosococcus oceani AFC27]|nr:hypothetical protein NOC27_3255 [Nitrosococcus oceani AFC27]